VGEDETSFWRHYRMWGDGFEYRITETFDQHLYTNGYQSETPRG
jgi:hypothetical protein